MGRSSAVIALGLLLIGASSSAAQSTAVVCGTVTDARNNPMPSPGATFTKTITDGSAAVKPCKIPGL